jgi:hypothetical protein
VNALKDAIAIMEKEGCGEKAEPLRRELRDLGELG